MFAFISIQFAFPSKPLLSTRGMTSKSSVGCYVPGRNQGKQFSFANEERKTSTPSKSHSKSDVTNNCLGSHTLKEEQ